MATLNSYESLLPAQTLGQIDQAVLVGPPAEPTPLPQIIAALRTVTQLEGLTEEEYTWIATHGTERVGPDRAIGCEDEGGCEWQHSITQHQISSGQFNRRHREFQARLERCSHGRAIRRIAHRCGCCYPGR